MIEKCGCCNGVGQVFMLRPTAGPSQIEDCSNCGGSGVVLVLGDAFTITFKRRDELPLAILKPKAGA